MQDTECKEIIEIAEGPSVCARPDRTPGRSASVMQEESAYSTKVWIEKPFEEVLAATRCSLSHKGLPVVWEMDIRQRFHCELDIAFPSYAILGVAKTDWIRQALELDRGTGLLMPFNLIVYEQRGGTVVEVGDPIAMFAIAGGDDLQRFARMVKQTLGDVIDHVAASAA